jgi:hypothetical protein
MHSAVRPIALALLGIPLALAGCGRSDPGELGPPERIILIVADTLRSDHVSAYASDQGPPPVPTPNIDALAQRGQVFPNAISSYHQTTMSMSSIFTGRTPSIERGAGRERLDWTGETWCGLERFGRGEPEARCIPDSVPTLAEALREGGYWTLGVASNKLMYRPGGYERGFERWIEIPGKPVPAALVNEAVIEALRKRPSDRLFLYVHLMDAHDYIFRHDAYADGVRFLDQAVGRLVSTLEALGLMEGSVVFFTSDHGEHLQGEQHFTRALRGHTGSPSFDTVLRVPLIVAPPRFAGTSAVVRGDDLHRMILQLAGLGSGPEPQLEPGELFLSEREFQTYRRGRWKSFRNRRTGRHHVVDLGGDPAETADVARAHPGVRSQHAARMDALAAELGSPGAPSRTLSAEDEARLRELGYLESE